MTTTTTTTKYTTYGNVRGWCGHRHRTEDAAQRCAAADARDCRAARGYSDRQVHDVADMIYWRRMPQVVPL